MASIEAFDVSSVMQRTTLTVRITGVRKLKARIWFGGLVMRLGARLMGVGHCNLTVE